MAQPEWRAGGGGLTGVEEWVLNFSQYFFVYLFRFLFNLNCFSLKQNNNQFIYWQNKKKIKKIKKKSICWKNYLTTDLKQNTF